MRQEFDKKKLDLVKQKGFYPYEYMANFEIFKEELPSREKFYSSLTGKRISEKGYELVLKVWNKFEMKTMKDHHNLYLKCDILLLADVFEKFRNNSLKDCRLYPSHCSSVLNWDVMLNITKVGLELITDPEILIFFGKGMRGRVSYISNRHSQANNKYLKSFDPKQELKHIIYLDANKLYGYAMSKFLAISGFKWTDSKEFNLNKHTTKRMCSRS